MHLYILSFKSINLSVLLFFLHAQPWNIHYALSCTFFLLCIIISLCFSIKGFLRHYTVTANLPPHHHHHHRYHRYHHYHRQTAVHLDAIRLMINKVTRGGYARGPRPLSVTSGCASLTLRSTPVLKYLQLQCVQQVDATPVKLCNQILMMWTNQNKCFLFFVFFFFPGSCHLNHIIDRHHSYITNTAVSDYFDRKLTRS